MVYVAEGTYGCVYRPPIKCKNGIKYTTGKVSKLMTRRAAKKEVTEYKLISKADKQQKYYTGPPISCEVDPADAKKEMTPGECKLFTENPNISDYELLIYNDGGFDLDKFVKTQLDKYLANNPRGQTDLFFLNAFNLFAGIKLFLENDILHHDVKPQNIVFDPKTYRFNFIDFGLAEKKSKLVNEIINETNKESFHWSYPMEFGFLNSKCVCYFKDMPPSHMGIIEDTFKHFTNPAYEMQFKNGYNIKPQSFNTTFRYMEDRLDSTTSTNFIKKYIKEMLDGLKEYQNKNKPYDKMVKDLLENTDIYALGFTMNHVLNAFFDKGAITADEYKRYSTLFKKMYEPNFINRTLYTIKHCLDWYSQILKNTGVLMRLGKKIENDEIKDINATPAVTVVNKVVPTTLVNAIKVCPPNHELNIATKRCRKMCLPHHFRDTNGKCKKTKKVHASNKVCPPDQELNVATNRCRKTCKQGTIRNSKGRCVKI